VNTITGSVGGIYPTHTAIRRSAIANDFYPQYIREGSKGFKFLVDGSEYKYDKKTNKLFIMEYSFFNGRDQKYNAIPPKQATEVISKITLETTEAKKLKRIHKIFLYKKQSEK
jgi:hypothetical protein